MYNMVIQGMDGETSSLSDDVPDHKRLSRWFLIQLDKTMLRRPDHCRHFRTSQILQIEMENRYT